MNPLTYLFGIFSNPVTKMVEETFVSNTNLAEQRRIVAKVDQLMALVDRLKTQIAAYRATAKNFLEAVVAELTSQSLSGIQ